MFRYGFELECFYKAYMPMTSTKDAGWEITLPPENYPVDGMAGLVELRTTDGKTLEDAYNELLMRTFKDPIDFSKLVFQPKFKFTPEMRRELRKRAQQPKYPVDVRSLKGKKPRALGDWVMASFQINVSYIKSFGRKITYTTNEISGNFIKNIEHSVTVPDQSGLIDTAYIVARLDTEFAKEIAESGRQQGEYALKGDRLEYRSLPCTVFRYNPAEIKDLLKRIRVAVEGK